MPCICYGATSGKDEYDDFIKSEKGQEAMQLIAKAAEKIKSYRVSDECMSYQVLEFKEIWAKCFLHMLLGCDEKVKDVVNPQSKTQSSHQSEK